MSFNDNLKLLLKDRNLKQADLCRMTGIQTSLMSDYLAGKKSPTIKNAIFIADALNISLDTLVSKVKSPGTIEDVPRGEISRIFDALNSMLISAGLIKDGSDITKKQGEVLLAVCQIIDSTFKD